MTAVLFMINLCSFIQIIFLEGSGFTFYITAGLEEIYDKYGALLLRMQPTLGCFQLTASCARSLLSSCLLFETKHFFQEREKLKGTQSKARKLLLCLCL